MNRPKNRPKFSSMAAPMAVLVASPADPFPISARCYVHAQLLARGNPSMVPNAPAPSELRLAPRKAGRNAPEPDSSSNR